MGTSSHNQPHHFRLSSAIHDGMASVAHVFRHRQHTPESDEETHAAKEDLHPEQKGSAAALQEVVANSARPGAATSGAGILGHADAIVKDKSSSWLHDLIPGIHKYAAQEQLGNYVLINRKTGEKTWEPMPIYVRVGMSLLFTGQGDRLLGSKYVNNLLLKQSIKQGKLFDSEEGAYEHIKAFVKTYHLESTLDQLLHSDLTWYKTFNQFFARQLKPDARPPASPEDPSVVVSAADCRLTVWENVTMATEFWIKGRQFSIPELLQDDKIAEDSRFKIGSSLAIFRLAPQDYHRWHSPLPGHLGPVKAIPGCLYTVNPMAVRNPDVNVFTANKRDIQVLNVPALKEGEPDVPVPIVSVGAMLVGSIAYTKEQGQFVQKGEELGYFAYGGSTVIVLFPQDFVSFDEDLVRYSKEGLEVVVKVGERIGSRHH